MYQLRGLANTDKDQKSLKSLRDISTTTKNKKKFIKVLEEIGEFGPWQRAIALWSEHSPIAIGYLIGLFIDRLY